MPLTTIATQSPNHSINLPTFPRCSTLRSLPVSRFRTPQHTHPVTVLSEEHLTAPMSVVASSRGSGRRSLKNHSLKRIVPQDQSWKGGSDNWDSHSWEAGFPAHNEVKARRSTPKTQRMDGSMSPRYSTLRSLPVSRFRTPQHTHPVTVLSEGHLTAPMYVVADSRGSGRRSLKNHSLRRIPQDQNWRGAAENWGSHSWEASFPAHNEVKASRSAAKTRRMDGLTVRGSLDRSGTTFDTRTHSNQTFRLIALGSRQAVIDNIKMLHHLGYAEAIAWSSLQRGFCENEFMSILTLKGSACCRKLQELD